MGLSVVGVVHDHCEGGGYQSSVRVGDPSYAEGIGAWTDWRGGEVPDEDIAAVLLAGGGAGRRKVTAYKARRVSVYFKLARKSDSHHGCAEKAVLNSDDEGVGSGIVDSV